MNATQEKRKKRFRKHNDIRVMFLSSEFRLVFKRNERRFAEAHPEFLKLPTKDQRYILQ